MYYLLMSILQYKYIHRLVYNENMVIAWNLGSIYNAFSGNEAISTATKLAAEPISLTTRTKMRNHLAEEVIDRNALDAFKVM